MLQTRFIPLVEETPRLQEPDIVCGTCLQSGRISAFLLTS